MAADEKWYFTKEQLQNTPSKQCGFDADKELSCRQQAANFIQDIGQKLQVSQLCINTAIVYMHRFYMFHSFTHFSWHTIAAAAIFLAAKVEEQPRKLEVVIKVVNYCLHRDQAPPFDVKSEQYAAQSQDLVFNENVLLQTLGFDVAIDHPHTHVVRCCHLVRASKDLAQTSYFMASNSLHLTTMCLQYKPTVVACFCIHLACKWSNWQIPKSNENKDWFYYVDKSVTSELLQQLTAEFLLIFDKCPSRLKKKNMSISNHAHSMDQTPVPTTVNTLFDERKPHPAENKESLHARTHHDAKQGALGSSDDPYKKTQRSHEASSSQPQPAAHPQRINHREYKEKRERIEREKAVQQHNKLQVPAVAKPLPPGAVPNKPPHNHHRPPANLDPKLLKHHRPDPSRDVSHHREQARDPHREMPKDAPPKQRDHVPLSDPNKPEPSPVEKQRYDPNRQKLTDPKLQVKHDPNRHRRDEQKIWYQKKLEAQIAGQSAASDKKSVTPIVTDKQNSVVKPASATMQRHKNDFTDVPKPAPVVATVAPLKLDSRNGNHVTNDEPRVKPPADPQPAPEETGIISPPPKKMPSLFSPEKSSPQKKTWKDSPAGSTKKPEGSALGSSQPPFGSPIGKPCSATQKRNRTSSSGSEPELRPVVKKLDEIFGFENIIRDYKMGIKLPKVPDIIQPINDRQELHTETSLSISKDLKPPEIIKPFNTSMTENVSSQPIVNGIETDPTHISNLLKEAPTLNHLPVVETKIFDVPTQNNQLTVVIPEVIEEKHKSEHHHKSEKKKKKDKHKHKDKDRTRDEKKKKHKDKDRHKIKEKTKSEESNSIKITITMDKAQAPVSEPSAGLKVKISKDRLKTESISDPQIPNGNTLTNPAAINAPGSLKIKIPKDAIQQYTSSNETRKRERTSPSIGAPPPKILKTNYSRNDPKPNGRNSYNKVAQLGEGETAQLRLAESKYHIKGTSKTS